MSASPPRGALIWPVSAWHFLGKFTAFELELLASMWERRSPAGGRSFGTASTR